MNQLVKLTDDQFWEQFKPVKNHLDNNASYDGHMFETYGQEHEFILEQNKANPLTIWTLVDGESGSCLIVNGWHYVNRMGYFVTEIPAEFGLQYNIEDDDAPECPEPLLQAFNNVIEHCSNEADYFSTGDGSETPNHKEISLHISKVGQLLNALLVEYENAKQDMPDFQLYEYIETNLLIKI
jgi:hypothetical protein